MFTSSIILLVEKLFLHFVAITFHQKALAERLEENRLGLKALDRLSNAQPIPNKRSPYNKRGYKSPSASVDLSNVTARGHKSAQNSREGFSAEGEGRISIVEKVKRRKNGRPRKNKDMASIIVDQV